MKTIFVIISLIGLSHSLAAQVVNVEMKNDHLKQGEKIVFNVRCLSEQDVEITVFSGECLVSQQKATLSPDTHPFEIAENPCKSGKYFVLITGREIHVEKEFFIE
ncbi:MAG: hypothetical protein IPP69_06765 [Flavobacteriales bacterium]|nr:hypothetical protein [Flavobacteriales bacterium]